MIFYNLHSHGVVIIGVLRVGYLPENIPELSEECHWQSPPDLMTVCKRSSEGRGMRERKSISIILIN